MVQRRHYGMDWLRIGAFALLIFYHIGMFFVPWDWHVKAPETLEWVVVPMLATNSWRLPLLFLVSGFASAAILSRNPDLWAFMRSRSARLLIPLVFGAFVIVPPQPWIELMTQHGYGQGYMHFWASDYFRFGTLGGIILPTWNHLWFVAYLWVYSIIAASLALAIRASRLNAVAKVMDHALGGIMLLILPSLYLLIKGLILFPGVEDTHALFDDWGAHAGFFPTFLFGILLWHSDHIWAAIRRWWKVAGSLAVIAYLFVAVMAVSYPGDTPFDQSWQGSAYHGARIVQGWCSMIALVGIADRYWNRDHPARAMLTEAVFPFYLIHQTIIVVVAWWLLSFGLPNGAMFAILVAVTATGCWLFYRVGRKIPGFRLLIGLKGWRTTA